MSALSSESDKRVRKRKLKRMAFGQQWAKQRHYRGSGRHELKDGVKGFLFTHNNNERGAIREAFQLLNEYAQRFGLEEESTSDKPSGHAEGKDEPPATADKLTGEVAEGTAEEDNEVEEEKEKEEEEDGGDDEDVSTTLQRECAELRQTTQGGAGDKRLFKQRQCSASNCLFIEMSPHCAMEPSVFCQRMMQDIDDSRKSMCRWLQRVVPVDCTSRCNVDSLRPAMEKIVAARLSQSAHPSGASYAVEFKSRNQNTMHRSEVIELCADIVRCVNVFAKVDLGAPDVSIVVETLGGNVCCAAVAADYAKLKRYSFHVPFDGDALDAPPPAESK